MDLQNKAKALGYKVSGVGAGAFGPHSSVSKVGANLIHRAPASALLHNSVVTRQTEQEPSSERVSVDSSNNGD